VRYEEVQYFHPAFHCLVLGLAAFLAIALISDLVFDHPLGTKPAPPGMLAVLLVLFAFLFFLFFRLTVRVRDACVEAEFGFLGWIRFRVPLDTVRACEAVTYRPLLEFGGWGIRYGRGGRRCYNARGNRGVLLDTSGGQIVIGSQQPDRLAEAIRSAVDRRE